MHQGRYACGNNICLEYGDVESGEKMTETATEHIQVIHGSGIYIWKSFCRTGGISLLFLTAVIGGKRMSTFCRMLPRHY